MDLTCEKKEDELDKDFAPVQRGPKALDGIRNGDWSSITGSSMSSSPPPPDTKQAQQETGQNTSTTTTTTTSPDYQEFVKQVKTIANSPQPTNAEKVGRTYLNTIPYTTIHKLAEIDT